MIALPSVRTCLVLFGFSLLGVAACTKDQALQTNPNIDCGQLGTISYADDVLPLLQRTCATGQGPGTGCHDSWINSYNSTKSKINSGTFENRVLIQQDMPVPGNVFGIAPLTEAQIDTIHCWIAQGSENN